jgi:hypothetical protein
MAGYDVQTLPHEEGSSLFEARCKAFRAKRIAAEGPEPEITHSSGGRAGRTRLKRFGRQARQCLFFRPNLNAIGARHGYARSITRAEQRQDGTSVDGRRVDDQVVELTQAISKRRGVKSASAA